MTHVLVGGKRREDVLAQRKRSLEELAREIQTSSEEPTPEPAWKPARPFPPEIEGTPEFWIKEQPGYTTINGVSHSWKHGEESIYQVDVSDNPITHMVGNRAEVTNSSVQGWKFHNRQTLIQCDVPIYWLVLSASWYMNIFSRVYHERENIPYKNRVEEFRKKIQHHLLEKRITTTVIEYTENFDFIDQHEGTFDHRFSANIKGRSGSIPQATDISTFTSYATGTHQAVFYNTVEWLTQAIVQLNRPMTTLQQTERYALGFGPGATIDAQLSPNAEMPAIGLRIRKIVSGGTK